MHIGRGLKGSTVRKSWRRLESRRTQRTSRPLINTTCSCIEIRADPGPKYTAVLSARPDRIDGRRDRIYHPAEQIQTHPGGEWCPLLETWQTLEEICVIDKELQTHTLKISQWENQNKLHALGGIWTHVLLHSIIIGRCSICQGSEN